MEKEKLAHLTARFDASPAPEGLTQKASTTSAKQGQKLVLGVGGGGSAMLNACKNLPAFKQAGCKALAVNWDNCDSAAFAKLPTADKIKLGNRLFESTPADMQSIKNLLQSNITLPVIDRALPVLQGVASVVVIAGIGGAAGSLVGPSIVKAAMAADIPTLAIWIKPFVFENHRISFFDWIVQHGIAARSPYYVAYNEKLMETLGSGVGVNEAFNVMNQHVAEEVVSPWLNQ